MPRSRKIVIRRAEPRDAEAMQAIFASPRAMAGTLQLPYPSGAMWVKRIADFPPDDSGYGFDNISDVLSLPPVLMEKYLSAADRIFDEAIVTDPIQSRVHRVPASLAQIGFNAFPGGDQTYDIVLK